MNNFFARFLGIKNRAKAELETWVDTIHMEEISQAASGNQASENG